MFGCLKEVVGTAVLKFGEESVDVWRGISCC